MKPQKTSLIVSACVALLCLQTSLTADVVVMGNGAVVTGKILQQDDEGVLIQTSSGTHRYPPSWIKEVRKEPGSAPHVSNNGQRIPDWAQIVTLLANTGWSQGLKQVPATMIETGIWKNVPYISFQCRSGGYELNIFGDLGNPAAVQIGAMTYLKQSPEAKSNCVNFICSLLPNAEDRKSVRGLSWDAKAADKQNGMMFETLMPGEWGSYGGWWITVYSETALAAARASDAELLMLTQPAGSAPQPAATLAAAPVPATAPVSATAPVPAGAPTAATPATTPPPPDTTAQPVPVAAYQVTPYWTDAELAAARRVVPGTPGVPPAATPAKVYPRTYTRAGGAYAHPAALRR